MPFPLPLAWKNESSTMFAVRSVIVPEKLTGMPCSLLETVPTPQATEWSFVVVVTVTVMVPRPVQVSCCCSPCVAHTRRHQGDEGDDRKRENAPHALPLPSE